MRKPPLVVAAAVGGLVLAALLGCALPRPGGPSSHNPSALASAFQQTTWIDYAPTNFDPTASPLVLPSDDSVRADLLTMRNAGFDGLITYGADVPATPRIAEEVGFQRLMLGIWDPSSAEELGRVREAAGSERVLAIIVGNEGLMFRRYDLATLRSAMSEMRSATGKLISTTETTDMFFTHPEIVDISDVLTVNPHRYFRGLVDPERAAAWTEQAFRDLSARVPHKTVFFKEVGLPTRGGLELSEDAQFEYYERLRRKPVLFAYFEGLDALFKRGAVEQSWGLFRADRTPKRIARAMIERKAADR